MPAVHRLVVGDYSSPCVESCARRHLSKFIKCVSLNQQSKCSVDLPVKLVDDLRLVLGVNGLFADEVGLALGPAHRLQRFAVDAAEECFKGE